MQQPGEMLYFLDEGIFFPSEKKVLSKLSSLKADNEYCFQG